MGGSLTNNKRTPAAEMLRIWESLKHDLEQVLEGARFQMVPYYRNKPDFGDIDVLVEGRLGDYLERLKSPYVHILEGPANYRAWDGPTSTNDGQFSFVSQGMQVDLIFVEHFDFALGYYSHNDLGNMVGRMYHRAGMKLGHTGLLYPVRDSSGKLRETVTLTTDFKEALEFIGLDHARWIQGFDRMEDVFEYVSSAKMFEPDMFDPETRPASVRKKDAKRKSYQAFSEWLSSEWRHADIRRSTGLRPDKGEWLRMINDKWGSVVYEAIDRAEAAKDLEDRFKEIFNGTLLMQAIPDLYGEALGRFIGEFKKIHSTKSRDVVRQADPEIQFMQNVVDAEPVVMKRAVEFYEKNFFVRKIDLNGDSKYYVCKREGDTFQFQIIGEATLQIEEVIDLINNPPALQELEEMSQAAEAAVWYLRILESKDLVSIDEVPRVFKKDFESFFFGKTITRKDDLLHAYPHDAKQWALSLLKKYST